MTENWKEFKNILCIRTDNMGDVLMTAPAIQALKESVPGRKITLLTSPSGKAITKLLPYVDDQIVFNFPWMNKEAPVEVINDAIMELERKEFDAAIIFTVYSQNPLPSAMLCRQAGITTIAAYCRENPYGLLSDWIPDREPLFEIKHEVQRQLELVKLLGAEIKTNTISIQISKEAEKRSHHILDKEGLTSKGKYIVIHPGVSEKRRQFPLETLAEAVESIYRKTEYQIVLTGLEKETELTNFINERLGGFGIDLAGKLDVEELTSVIKNAELLISNNTGPVHLAAATQTLVLVLYALTNPQHLPWQTNYTALPFEVPAEIRSKNVIIEYAYQKAFKDKPRTVKSRDIADACIELLELSDQKQKTDILSL